MPDYYFGPEKAGESLAVRKCGMLGMCTIKKLVPVPVEIVNGNQDERGCEKYGQAFRARGGLGFATYQGVRRLFLVSKDKSRVDVKDSVTFNGYPVVLELFVDDSWQELSVKNGVYCSATTSGEISSCSDGTLDRRTAAAASNCGSDSKADLGDFKADPIVWTFKIKHNRFAEVFKECRKFNTANTTSLRVMSFNLLAPCFTWRLFKHHGVCTSTQVPVDVEFKDTYREVAVTSDDEISSEDDSSQEEEEMDESKFTTVGRFQHAPNKKIPSIDLAVGTGEFRNVTAPKMAAEYESDG